MSSHAGKQRAMRKGYGVWSLIGLAAAVAGAAGVAGAAPVDDHQRGLAAWQRGDVVAAMRDLRTAADAGHVPSQTLLAFILDRAGLVDESVRLYRAAAERGDAEGHAGLAAALLGGRGIAKDEKQAWLHFSKAAEGDHLPSIDLLAQAYRSGQPGLAADAAAAGRWRARGEALRKQQAAASAPGAR
jgi:TPR repeat protein